MAAGRSRVGLKRMPFVPLHTQILPRRIDRHDQSDLLDPQPAFDLVLALDRIMDILEALEVNQPIKLVLRRKTRSACGLMLPHSLDQVPRNPCVHRLRPVRHEDEISPGLAHNALSLAPMERVCL